MQQTGTEADEANHLWLDCIVQHPLGRVVKVGLKLQRGLTVSQMAQDTHCPSTV